MAINIFHGDCLEIMKTLPDKSVDMCLTDPPYGTTACKWDNVIPFEPMWEQLHRIVKPNGAICLFGSEPFSSRLRVSNLKRFKYDWVWFKENRRNSGFQHAKNRPLKATETISVFSLGKINHQNQTKNKMIYYPQGLKPHGKIRSVEPSKHFSTLGKRENQVGKKYEAIYTCYPNDVLVIDSEKKSQHPTQKPVPLLEYLIKTYTLEGETVLDFTMGSGSTGVACKNLNRKFVGIELDEKYFSIAEKRIEGLNGDQL